MLIGRFDSLLVVGCWLLDHTRCLHAPRVMRDRRATDGIERIEETHELMPGMTSRAVKTEGRDRGA